MTAPPTRLIAALTLLLAAPATAQRPGTVEVDGLARYTNFDNDLGMESTIGAGGRVTVYAGPGLALELDVSRTSAGRPVGTEVTYTPVHLRVVYRGPVSERVEALVGGGYVRNWYGKPIDASDGGLSTLLGLRYRLTNVVWLRLGADGDVMFHTADDSPFSFYNGNWGLHLGAGIALNR
jgi:outer membrane protein with beta-barrel domain